MKQIIWPFPSEKPIILHCEYCDEDKVEECPCQEPRKFIGSGEDVILEINNGNL